MNIFNPLCFLSSRVKKQPTTIIIDPPPRTIEKTLNQTHQIYLHCLTGPVRKNEKDLLFLDIEVVCILLGVFNSNGVLTVFLIKNENSFYVKKQNLFKDWLNNPNNTLVFFYYGYSLVPFLKIFNQKEMVKAQLIDIFLLCARVNNDVVISSKPITQSLGYWLNAHAPRGRSSL